MESASGAGRPGYYQDREVVASYHLRYESGFAKWKHERKKSILRSWIKKTNPTRLLEVACGPGRFYETYRDYRATACDLSSEMLEELRSRFPEASLVRADALALPFRPQSFDVVFATRFLSHLRGEFRRRVLAELVRVSRRRVILDARHCYNLRYLSRWMRRRLGLARADKLRHTYGQFRRELEEAGLEVLEVRSIAWGLSARFLVLCEKR
ncbi:MAG TPA: class I SAM-dependent methyltransferase [Planctomycetota bacterium]|nr:class I SAM-dependent methyltransferase [Planctomycetota bacterium]